MKWKQRLALLLKLFQGYIVFLGVLSWLYPVLYLCGVPHLQVAWLLLSIPLGLFLLLYPPGVLLYFCIRGFNAD